ncbi:hypothetical protein [Solilutibacter silvestris]|uniref:hypothetical protein n=1 Tax=Solilutibacter silvestris TaxID=1645665 RepID=UPI003D35475F
MSTPFVKFFSSPPRTSPSGIARRVSAHRRHRIGRHINVCKRISKKTCFQVEIFSALRSRRFDEHAGAFFAATADRRQRRLNRIENIFREDAISGIATPDLRESAQALIAIIDAFRVAKRVRRNEEARSMTGLRHEAMS